MVHAVRNRFTLMNNRRRVADWLHRMDDARQEMMAVTDTDRASVSTWRKP
jgi:hypothetical protein